MKLGLFRLDSQLFGKRLITVILLVVVLRKILLVPVNREAPRFSEVILELWFVVGFGEDAFQIINNLLGGPGGYGNPPPIQLDYIVPEFPHCRKIGKLECSIRVGQGNGGHQFALQAGQNFGDVRSRTIYVAAGDRLKRRSSPLVGRA